MNLPKPPAAYDTTDQAQMRRTLIETDKRTLKIGDDILFGANDAVFASPSGAKWKLVVDDAGTVSAVPA